MDRLNATPAMTAEPATDASDGAAPQATVHVDLDGAAHIFRLHGWRWTHADDPVYDSGVRHALDLFDRFGVRATFFVIAEDLDHPVKAELLREITRRGHELGSHSLTHAPLRELSVEHKRREIFASRDRIADALDQRPAGFRAPNFSIDRASIDLIAEAGYDYDSSIVPGARVPGYAQEHDHAPRLIAGELVELPLPAHRPLPFSFHPSYSLVLGLRYFHAGLARFRRSRAPFVMLYHLIDFADPLPASRLRGWAQRLYTLSFLSGERKRERCQRMLEAVKSAYTVTDTSAIVHRALAKARRANP
jgi:hypothetical protein